MRICRLFLALLFITTGVHAQSTNEPDVSLISEQTIKNDLLILASDSMKGRSTGTIDELRAAAWIAQRAREAGLEPAGGDGTYI